MQSHTGRFPVTLMCRTLAVSSSGYYAWAARPESRRSAENRRLVTEIRVIHAESRATTDSSHTWPVAANTLNRQFTIEHPNRVWAGDMTYIWTAEGGRSLV